MRYDSSSKTSSNRGPTILVLGGGYLGNKIGDYLASSIGGFDVKIVKASLVDYHDKKEMWRLLVNQDPEYVINCSGFTGRPNIDEAESKKEECWEYNVRSPLRVANACHQYGVKHIHISSGCIYTGYEKEYTETDTPNFGLWDISSTYSKTKHAYEFLSQEFSSKILRIRMPISGNNDRCYLSKIKNYDNLIDYTNSKTYIPDLCEFVYRLVSYKDIRWKGQDIYNIVNPEPLTTKTVCELMFLAKDFNPNWKFVPLNEIPIVAPRSNCVLDNSKAGSIMTFRTEFAAMLDLYKNNLEGLQLTPEMLS